MHADHISVCLAQRSQLRCLWRLGRLRKRVKSARWGEEPIGNGMAFFSKEGGHCPPPADYALAGRQQGPVLPHLCQEKVEIQNFYMKFLDFKMLTI